MIAETLALEPDRFLERFIVPDEPIPGGVGKEIIDDVLQDKTGGLETFIDEVLAKAEALNYQTRLKPETLERQFLDKYSEYVLMKQTGKHIVNPDLYDEGARIAESWQQDRHIRSLLEQANFIQHQFKGTLCDTECHGTTDFVVEQSKTMQVADFKVVGGEPRYWSRKFRWDIQGAFYTDLLGQHTDKEILPPVFIVTHKDYPEHPLIYRLSERSLNTGRGGNGYVEGYEQLLARYNWHKLHNKWDYPQEFYLTGILELDVLTP